MKTEFKAKFLQHVAKRKREGGFTLIELLVVIIIIGILSAIALPSFLNQANKAKQSEAKQYISSVNKGMQAYYAEKSNFLDEDDAFIKIQDLGLGIKTETTNYQYNLIEGDTTPNVIAVQTNAAPATGALNAYAGGVALLKVGDATTTGTIICEQEVEGDSFDATNGAISALGIGGNDENPEAACAADQTPL